VSSLSRPRSRDLGVPFTGTSGRKNAITDVNGVRVGHSTIISGNGPLRVGSGPIRTGVTAVIPRADPYDPVFAGWSYLNGNGEMTGTTWVDESGFLSGPVMITNTHSVGVVHDAVIDWVQRLPRSGLGNPWSLPVVAETYDGQLNDINGFHVKPKHVFKTLEVASDGRVGEGNIGGGTGMICHQFKGGVGTSSRLVKLACGEYVVGVLVQANYGLRDLLTIAGVPVGREISDLMPEVYEGVAPSGETGSIIVVVATDAPLLPHQLTRLARRAPLGVASDSEVRLVSSLPNELMTDLFRAVVEATEEAIVNALVAAETMVGVNGNKVYALPHDRLQAALRKYNRLVLS
jgi:D-aminopeptidase